MKKLEDVGVLVARILMPILFITAGWGKITGYDWPQMQKSLLIEQAFRIWSVIEDLNLRPLRPERSALPGCANHRMRGASYCADTPSSIP